MPAAVVVITGNRLQHKQEEGMKYAATYEYRNGRAVVQIGQLGKDRTEFRTAGEGVGDDMGGAFNQAMDAVESAASAIQLDRALVRRKLLHDIFAST
jgi:hypothetical protein